MAADADTVVWQLEQLQSDSELAKVRKRLGPGEAAIGIRIRDLFATAKAHTDLDLVGVDRLLDQAAYEPRMAAMCILDFKARRRLDEAGRCELADIYLRRHDRITTWDMVDRAAPACSAVTSPGVRWLRCTTSRLRFSPCAAVLRSPHRCTSSSRMTTKA